MWMAGASTLPLVAGCSRGRGGERWLRLLQGRGLLLGLLGRADGALAMARRRPC